MRDEAPRSNQNPPQATIDVSEKHVEELNDLEPGDAVRVVLEGKVVEVSQREPNADIPGFSGMLRLEFRRLRVGKQDNSFAELLEDDDG